MTWQEPSDGEAGQFGVSLELTARIGSTLERMDNRLERDAAIQAPVFYRTGASDVVPAAGTTLTLRLGGPDQGHFWYVRSIVVGGTDPTVAAAGAADVFVTAADPRQTQPSLLDWRDRATVLPLIAFYGRGELPLRMSEELWVRFTAATAGQMYACAIQVEDMVEAAGRQDWTR